MNFAYPIEQRTKEIWDGISWIKKRGIEPISENVDQGEVKGKI